MSKIIKLVDVWKYNLITSYLMPITQSVINEETLQLIVNGEPWLNFVCTPSNIEALAVGFLYNEGIIKGLEEINKITIDHKTIDVMLSNLEIRSGLLKRTSTGTSLEHRTDTPSVQSQFQIIATDLIKLYNLFLENQEYHKDVGGFHCAALSDGKNINIKFEDVGRHNCIDKICGQFLMKNQPFKPQVMLLTGRISSEMVLKTKILEVPMIVSRTTPTAHAVEIADQLGLCIVGYLRNDSFSIYSHPERITIS